MPQFYFHLHDGQALVQDSSGVSLPDAEAAFYQAYRRARELLGGAAGAERDPRRVEVEDGNGESVWSLPLHEIREAAA